MRFGTARIVPTAHFFLAPVRFPVIVRYRTRSERPMRRMVVDLMPFSRQRFATVVP